MAINATTYLVETKYLVDDKATRALGGIGKSAQAASGSVGALKRHLMGLGAAALGGAGMVGIKKGLLDFNSDMEQLRIRMAGLLDMNVGGGFERRLGTAKDLVGELQLRAEKSTSTTKELAFFLGETIMPLTKAGIRVKDLARFTDLAVSAAKAFGAEDIAALDIQQALGPEGIHARDRFGQKLLGIAKLTQEEFNKLGSNKKLAVLFKSLEHPSIMKMKGAQEHSFLGELSTTIDKLQLQLGQMGIPLFKAITAEFKSWNAWLAANPIALQNMASQVGSALKDGFGFVKGVFSFIVDHKDILLSIAKGFLLLKGIQMGVGAIGGIAGSLSGSTGSLIGNFKMLGNTTAGLGARMQAFGGVLSAAALAAVGIQIAFEHAGQKIVDQQNRRAKYGSFAMDAGDMAARTGSAKFGGQGFDNRRYVGAARRTLASARESGILNDKGGINENLLRMSAQSMPEQVRGVGQEAMDKYIGSLRTQLVAAIEVERSGAIATFKTMQESAEVLARANFAAGRALMDSLGGGGLMSLLFDSPEDQARTNAKDNINVHISKVVVPAKDPDRWIIDLGRFAAKQVRAPRQARGALRS